jgi:3-oxoacyl-[acyl-carrier-protein] synthase II
MTRRVAVTGMGIVTSHGIGKTVNWQKTVAGESSIRPITLFDTAGYRTTRAGQLAVLPLAPCRRMRGARLDRASHLLYHATAEALDESGVTAAEWNASRSAVALGTTLGGMASGERYHRAYVRTGPARTRPSRVVDAVGCGVGLIRAGQADLALCGGYDPLCEFAFAGFHSLQALTSELCRPFDRRRSGLAIGEGAGVFLLEAWDRARARGARILGEVLGYGESNDAFHMTRPDPEGKSAALAVRRALQDAGAAPESVGYVNAHGTGTPFNDASETASLLAALGPRAREIPVSSSKSMIGHLLGAAGAVEGILTVLALQTGWLPPNVNYETPDPECDLRIVRAAARADGMRVALSNSFGFGGANAVLVFRAVGADS